MRISYLCTANLDKILKKQNQKILKQKKTNVSQFNCAGSCNYPLKGGNCRSMNIVHKATVNSGHETKFCIDLYSTHFRYANHKCGLYENNTEISKYMCSLKRKIKN